MNDVLQEPLFAAFVAFDWADQEHAGALCPATSCKVEAFQLKQTPEALDEWAAALRTRFGGQPVAVALEQSKGALIYALMKYEFLVLYPVNPQQLACFREAMGSSGAKDDPTDAAWLLELLVKHRDRLHPWRPDDATTRLLAQLAEDRRALIDVRTRLSNAVKSRLKQYFPLALEVLGELDTELAARFLLRWSSLEELQREEPQEIAAFYRQMHCNHPRLIEERLKKIAPAVPLVNDTAIITSGQLLIRTLAAQLLALVDPLKQYEVQVSEIMKQHPDAGIFQSFPGAGDALAPRLLVAFGSDRARIESPDQMQCLSGIAPVTVQSGKSCHVHRRWACNKYLRQTFHEFALHSLPRSVWAKAYYDMVRARGMHHQAAVRALAFKWIRILHRCWKTRTKYNEILYLQQLQKKNSPILKFIAENSQKSK
jgi:transposase